MASSTPEVPKAPDGLVWAHLTAARASQTPCCEEFFHICSIRGLQKQTDYILIFHSILVFNHIQDLDQFFYLKYSYKAFQDTSGMNCKYANISYSRHRLGKGLEIWITEVLPSLILILFKMKLKHHGKICCWSFHCNILRIFFFLAIFYCF